MIDALEHAFELGQGALVEARAVLRDYGNMSAATVMFVLERLIQSGLPARTLLTAMGPGIYRKLRRFEESLMIPAVVLLGAVTAERLAELWLARCNTADLLAKGAREFAPSHYPAIVLLHAFWLAGLWLFGWMHPLSSFWLMIFLCRVGQNCRDLSVGER